MLCFFFAGLGDIVMPGLLLCFVLRYDAYKKSQGLTGSRLTYFHCSLLGYFLGLLTATVSSEVFKAAQPALLYLVPFTLLPLLTMAYLKVRYFLDILLKCNYVSVNLLNEVLQACRCILFEKFIQSLWW